MTGRATSASSYRLPGLALIAGAAVDLVIGMLILLAPAWLAALTGVVLPDDLFFARLCAILLIALAALYAVAGLQPARHTAIVVVAAMTRFSAATLLLSVAASGANAKLYTVLAVAEGALALVHTGHAIVLLRRGAVTQAAALRGDGARL